MTKTKLKAMTLQEYIDKKGTGNKTDNIMLVAQELDINFYTVLSWLRKAKKPSRAAQALLRAHGIRVESQ